MYTKLSNVIGAPFDIQVRRQLEMRAGKNSTLTRTNEEVLFLANKMSWARLVSSVNIDPSNATGLYTASDINPANYPNADSLARNWILEAGTSIQQPGADGIALRAGIGDGDQYAYGLGGTKELGYRPMPGLTSVEIQTMGTLGSLRQATINFKVWNMNQLNVIEALYFRLGYSMLLEWGHVQYYTNNGVFKYKDIYGITDPFAPGKRKEDIQQEIKRKSKDTDGNYDGMLGIVSNFTWSFNQSGGYDCMVRLIGLGAIMDTVRINQSYTLPQGLIKRYKEDISAIDRRVAAENAPATTTTGTTETTTTVAPLPEINSYKQAWDVAREYGNSKLTLDSFLERWTRRYPIFPKNYNSTTNQPPIQYAKAIGLTAATFYKDNFNKKADYEITNVRAKYPGVYIVQSAAVGITGKVAYIPDPITGASATATIDTDQLKIFFEQLYTDREPAPDRETYQFDNVFMNRLQYVSNERPGLRNDYNTLDTVIDEQELIQGDRQQARIGGDLHFLNITLTLSEIDNDYPVTRKLLLTELDKQLRGVLGGFLAEASANDGLTPQASIKLTGTFKIQVPASARLAGGTAAKVKDTEVTLTIFTSNPGIVVGTSKEVSIAALPSPTQPANTGTTAAVVNKPDAEQVDAPQGFQSALHAMLVIIRAEVQANTGLANSQVGAVDIYSTTKQFYNSGILKGVLDTTAPTAGPNGVPFSRKDSLTLYALKGFNSELMGNPELYDVVDSVDFRKLCKAYLVRYPQTNEDGTRSQIKAPVYISMGYLLAFLNNMCLVYDSTTKQTTSTAISDDKRPYFYIDFNPNTNLCLTSPQQFSVDPSVCLIPLGATQQDYADIFQPTVKSSSTTLADGTSLLNPAGNAVSSFLSATAPFRNDKNGYQGKIMDIMLNIDYLLSVVDSYQNSDPEHGIYLQGFLERILVDVNKALGNINLFSVIYRDDTNTLQIQDGQWVPKLDKESTVLLTNSVEKDSPSSYLGEIPVFGQQSLAREFQIKTVISTKLASMIAISAQAYTGSVNATDHSSFSWLNQSYTDRYKPYIKNPDNGSTGVSQNGKAKGDDTQVKAATLFNAQIAAIYTNPTDFQYDKIDLGKSYYIEAMSGVKSTDKVTTSAPFIPADVELTLDGISGIIMGNAFLIPEDRLPLSLRGYNGVPKIGFVVTKLNHKIDQNQWTTSITGQMIKLRDSLAEGTGRTISANTSTATVNASTAVPRYPGACPDYKGADQVPASETVDTWNFKTRYPGYTFQKGVSDINLKALGLQPLTEAEIIDDTRKNRFDRGRNLKGPAQYFFVHHTAGIGDGTAYDVYKTFYCRGYPTQYVVDRNGKVHRFMPDGATGAHVKAENGRYNNISIGVEVVAVNDDDVLPIQRDATIRLAHFLGFKVDQLLGHGKVQDDKCGTEGYTVIKAVNPSYTPGKTRGKGCGRYPTP